MTSIHDQRYIETVALLRKAREGSGLTQRDLARLLGRPQSYVSKVETCERRLDYVELLQLCRAIGVALHVVTPAEFHDLLAPPASKAPTTARTRTCGRG